MSGAIDVILFLAGVIGVVAGVRNLWLWRRGGYWMPARAHAYAGAAVIVCALLTVWWYWSGQDRLWAIASMIVVVPLLVYAVWIVHGGVEDARRREANHEDA